MRICRLVTRIGLGAALVASLAAVAILRWPIPPSRVNCRNFLLVERGGHRGTATMSWWEIKRTEVEAILGAPGDYRTGPVRSAPPPTHTYGGRPQAFWGPRSRIVWLGDEIDIYMDVDASGWVRGVATREVKPLPRDRLDDCYWPFRYWWLRWTAG